MGNLLMLLFVAAISVGVVVVALYRMKNETPTRNEKVGYTMDTLLTRVKYKLADITKETDDVYALTDEEYDALYARRSRILTAMRNCVYAIDEDKIIVKELIREEVIEALPTPDDIFNVINFNDTSLSARIKFEILLYLYKRKHKKNALKVMIEENGWHNPRPAIDGMKWQTAYYVTDDDIDDLYRKVNPNLDYDSMIDVIVVLLYQKYKGLGIIDTIREMNIDGINCGVSGSVLSNVTSGMNTGVKTQIEASRSVWVQYNGRYIHFRFLDFGRIESIQRVASTIISYNSPGALTEKTGFIVNTMPDKTRVLAIRPPMGEYYGMFIRKFTLSNNELPSLLNPKDKKIVNGAEVFVPRHHNTQLPEEYAMWLMRGKVTTAVTGRQSSGKTTTMKALVQYIDPKLNIRVIETAPEMYLRELYPNRNIFESQETPFITTTDIQNAYKKSDGGVTMVGEVANSEMAARMIEAAKVASEQTLFTSHHKTSTNLVEMLRNDLVTVVPGTPAAVAEKLVVDAIPIDYHQDFDSTTGDRYIARVTAIIPLDEGVPYPDIDETSIQSILASYTRIFREYAMRTTDRRSFITRDTMVFDKTTQTYLPVNMLPSSLIEYIIGNLRGSEIDDFKRFVIRNWVDKKIC